MIEHENSTTGSRSNDIVSRAKHVLWQRFTELSEAQEDLVEGFRFYET